MLEILNGKRNEIDSVKILSHIGYYVFLNKKNRYNITTADIFLNSNLSSIYYINDLIFNHQRPDLEIDEKSGVLNNGINNFISDVINAVKKLNEIKGIEDDIFNADTDNVFTNYATTHFLETTTYYKYIEYNRNNLLNLNSYIFVNYNNNTVSKYQYIPSNCISYNIDNETSYNIVFKTILYNDIKELSVSFFNPTTYLTVSKTINVDYKKYDILIVEIKYKNLGYMVNLIINQQLFEIPVNNYHFKYFFNLDISGLQGIMFDYFVINYSINYVVDYDLKRLKLVSNSNIELRNQAVKTYTAVYDYYTLLDRKIKVSIDREQLDYIKNNLDKNVNIFYNVNFLPANNNKNFFEITNNFKGNVKINKRPPTIDELKKSLLEPKMCTYSIIFGISNIPKNLDYDGSLIEYSPYTSTIYDKNNNDYILRHVHCLNGIYAEIYKGYV